MAKPKLALIPAAQGSKFYSVLPSSGVGDFDFSRSGSATRINSQGLIETVGNGVSRLNYPLLDGKVVGCPSHILEPQRTNLLLYSEDFSQWIPTRSSVSINNLISPDGTLNADKLSETSDTGFHAISQNITVISGVSHTVSVFIKKGTNEFVQILFGTNNVIGNPYVNFDINKGVFENNGTTSPNIEYFGNGWYRCSTTVTTASTSFTYFISSIQSISDSRASSFTGNVNNNIYIYGAMLEQGSYPTSYIKSNGSSVTRSAEVANGSGDASTFNDSEGVLMVEISALTETVSANNWISLTDGTTNENNYVSIQQESSGNIIGRVRVNGLNSAVMYSAIIDQSLSSKIAIKYKLNNFSLYVNGFEYDSINVGSIFPTNTLSKLSFDYNSLSNYFYGNTKQVQYYDSALTDSELEQLTSWVSFSDMANGQLYTIE